MCTVSLCSRTSQRSMNMEHWVPNHMNISPCYFIINVCKTAELGNSWWTISRLFSSKFQYCWVPKLNFQFNKGKWLCVWSLITDAHFCDTCSYCTQISYKYIVRYFPILRGSYYLVSAICTWLRYWVSAINKWLNQGRMTPLIWVNVLLIACTVSHRSRTS